MRICAHITHMCHQVSAQWSRGMIPALGAGGPGLGGIDFFKIPFPYAVLAFLNCVFALSSNGGIRN